MNKKYLLLVPIMLLACQKVVNKVPLDIISDSQLWNDKNLVDAYTANLYNRALDAIWDQDQSISLVNISDEARCGLGWPEVLTTFTLGIITPSNVTSSSFVPYWRYPAIRACNEFLNFIEDGTLPDEYKAQRSAEVRFLRAYIYFQMVIRYGGVPLITTPQEINDELFVQRNSEKEIYDFVGKELDDIINILPESNPASDYARINKYTALALKSRAMLYAGTVARYGTIQLDGLLGLPANEANSYFQQSYEASKQIINEGPYELFDKYGDKVMNYRQLFLEKNNSEVILAKKYQGLDRGNSWDRWQQPYRYKDGVATSVNPTLEMINSYERTDGTPANIDYSQKINTSELFKDMEPRFKATILHNQSYWIDDTIRIYYFSVANDLSDPRNKNDIGYNVTGSAAGTTQTGFYMAKYLQSKRDMGLGESNTDFIIFRLGEIYLNLAEASYELGGHDEEALDAINEIRERGGVASRSSIDLDKIRHERKIELAFEGLRYWDVRRWRTAVDDLSGIFHKLNVYYIRNLNTYGYEIINCQGNSVRLFQEHNYYIPISQNDRIGEPKLIQNPEYE